MSAQVTTNDTTGTFDVVFRRLLWNTSVCSSVMTAAGSRWQVRLCTGSRNVSYQTTPVVCFSVNVPPHCVQASFGIEMLTAQEQLLIVRGSSNAKCFISSHMNGTYLLGKNMWEGVSISLSHFYLEAITVRVTLSICGSCGS
jgi:hypothetical protein